tara:strand:- start:527 stop:1012 length:486 start_codon:yes stop_codon:yes gene_type:complete
MAFQTTWYFSELPESVVGLIERDLADDSSVSDTHWIGGLIWHYIDRANRENFLYELSHLDNNSVKFKSYNEGDGQTWHVDAKPVEDDEDIRKLSFTLQLSDVDDYEGGNVQFKDEASHSYYMPRKRGTIAVFDSRALHRVRPVTKGTRKSLVGWALGKNWI